MGDFIQSKLDNIEYIKNKQKLNLIKRSSGLGFFVFSYYCAIMAISTALQYLLIFTVDFGQNGTYASTPLFLMSIVYAVASSLITGLLYCFLSKQKVSDLVMTDHVKFNKMIPVVFVGMAAAMISNEASDILANNFSIFGLENTVNFSDEVHSVTEIFLYIISTAIVPAFAEEFAFRGILLGALRKYGDVFAIIASAVMFAAVHRNITQIVFAFILGLIFGFIVCKTNSIVPSILIHFINNAYAVVIDILNTTEIISERMYISIYFLLVSGFCILGIISFIYLIKKDSSFFKITDNKTDYCILNLKEKSKVFFLSSGVLIALVCFAIETIRNLGVI